MARNRLRETSQKTNVAKEIVIWEISVDSSLTSLTPCLVTLAHAEVIVGHHAKTLAAQVLNLSIETRQTVINRLV